jgi:Na+/H+-dicarboxylate symporter/ABC-type amino acid transport substrate-binding protein
MTLSTQVLIALLLGIATGLFFGEPAAQLQLLGDAFVMLLQMTVMPFILVSLVSALGKLDPKSARELGAKAGGFLILVWAIVLFIIGVLPVAFPDLAASSFFSSSLVASQSDFDFLALYIPSNPVYALSNNIVPALVLFSVILGLALIPIDDKQGILRALDVLTDALTRITGWVARLAPVGVFALISSAAGTMSLVELERLQVYVVVYAAIALVLSLVILPGLVAALTPMEWRDVVLPIRGAIITAFAAGNLLIVIPILRDEGVRIASSKARDSARAASAVDVIVPASFNFPSAGKLLSMAFVPFAAWFTGSSISAAEYPRFLITGLFTFFGHSSVAIPFLLDMLRLPGDLFDLFLAVDVITGRFQVMVATMSTVSLAYHGACAMSGSLQFELRSCLRFVVVSAIALIVVLPGTRVLYQHVLDQDSASYRAFVSMDLSRPATPARVVEEEPGVPPERLELPRLDRIERDGLLRVCYFADSLPYVFKNAANHLVGFDVEMAYALASELSAEVEFLKIDRRRLVEHLDGGTCDIAMTGRAITPRRTREVAHSIPYLEANLGFVIRDHVRDDFATWERLKKRSDLRLVVPPVAHYVAILERPLPNATLTPLGEIRGYFRSGGEGYDALVHGAESGSAWTLVYPEFSVAVPQPATIRIPLAYPMPKGDDEFKIFVDTWIGMVRGSGVVDALFEHWILGRAAQDAQPRWSVLDDVIRAGRQKGPAEPASDPES